MIKLTKTPILPNCQVPNGFFLVRLQIFSLKNSKVNALFVPVFSGDRFFWENKRKYFTHIPNQSNFKKNLLNHFFIFFRSWLSTLWHVNERGLGNCYLLTFFPWLIFLVLPYQISDYACEHQPYYECRLCGTFLQYELVHEEEKLEDLPMCSDQLDDQYQP